MKVSIFKDGPSILTGALIPVGSRHEEQHEKGISHFVEHSLFKGTKNRDKNILKKEIEKFGASFNAWTSDESTFYYITIGKEFVSVARDVIQDMVANSIFPQEEVDPEREVILQEVQMYEDNPSSYIFELADRSLYPATSGLHLPVIGTRETIKNMTRDTLVNHFNKHYKDPIYIEIGPGKDQHDENVIDNKFGWEAINSNEDFIVTRSGINQTNMVLTGTINFKNSLDAAFDMDFLAETMNGFCGRLFDTIREKNHLVYSTSFNYRIFSGGTVQYWVYAALDAENIEKARVLMLQELTRPVTEDEAEFVKNKWIGGHQLVLDSKSSLAGIAIKSILKGFDYNEITNNYHLRIEESKSRINDLIKYANFQNSKLVAIKPEK